MTNTSFDWQIDEFMVNCRSRQLREKTMASYEQALRLFERWCKEQMQIDDVCQVTEGVIRRYINDLQERGKYTFYSSDEGKETNFPDRRRDFRRPISVTTINNYIRNLRAFFNWLDIECVTKKNPMKKVRQLKTNRKAKEYISDEDFKRLISCLDKSYYSEHRDYAMIMLMIDTGMRLGECSSLLLEDMNLAKRQIALRAEITKGRKDRMVYFSPKTERIMRRWIQYKDRYSETDYLFPTRSNTGDHMCGVVNEPGTDGQSQRNKWSTCAVQMVNPARNIHIIITPFLNVHFQSASMISYSVAASSSLADISASNARSRI